MGLQKDFAELKERAENEYSDYKNTLNQMITEYNNRCSEFDGLIATINGVRLDFRKEIRGLYDFLKTIGGSLNNEKRISVFEFADEAPAPNQIYTEIAPVDEPNYKKIEGLDLLLAGILLPINHMQNQKMLKAFQVGVEEKATEYENDIQKRKAEILYLKDAIEIAKIYRSIIVTVKDTISEKIIPELDLIQAFLYADAIRELILDGEKPEDIAPFGISEYKGTKQDLHYQFVKNTFDFYRISTTFFKQTVLTDILEDRIVTEEEKELFNKQVAKINKQITAIESKRTM